MKTLTMKLKNSTNTNENSKLTLKNDILFKYFFSKNGNEKYLQAFLDYNIPINVDTIKDVRNEFINRANNSNNRAKNR